MPSRIRDFFEAEGFVLQEWDRVRTDWLTIRPSHAEPRTTGRSRPLASTQR